jgi:hypothetical protein
MNGPHTATSGVADAIDLQPPDAPGRVCETFTSAFWAVAAAPGRATVMANAVEVDHGSGFKTGYYHLADKQVRSGDKVEAGQRLGRPGCCPDGGAGVDCWASEPHLHFYTAGPGSRQPIAGQHIGGWLVDEDGCLVRPDQRACRGAALISNAPRFEGVTPANVALTVALDVSASMDSASSNAAVTRLLTPFVRAAQEGEPITLITFDERSRVARIDTRDDVDRLVDAAGGAGGKDATDVQAGLGRACAEMRARGPDAKQALILITDGFHNGTRLVDPARCFREAGWRVFPFSAGRANAGLLTKIAAETGGIYKTASSIFDPACELERVRGLVAGSGDVGCSRFLLMPGDRLSAPFYVPPEQAQGSVVLGAASPDTPPGVGLGMVLRRPDGKILSPHDAMAHESDGRAERYAIATPSPGTWEVVVSGRDVPAEGVLVDISFVTTPVTFGYLSTLEPTGTSPITDGEATGTPTPDPEPKSTPTATPSPGPSRAPISPTPAPTLAPTPLRPTATPAR